VSPQTPRLRRIDNFIGPADTFSAVAGGDTGDASLQRTVTTLAALLRVENEQSVQRAILYAALSAQPPVLVPDDRISLLQAAAQKQAEPGRLRGRGLGLGTLLP
jgi:hypothetical protein